MPSVIGKLTVWFQREAKGEDRAAVLEDARQRTLSELTISTVTEGFSAAGGGRC